MIRLSAGRRHPISSPRIAVAVALLIVGGHTVPATGSREPAEPAPVTLRLAMAADPDSLDPHRSSASMTEQIMLNVFDGLLNPTPDGGVEPGIAESYTISPDGLTYTFTLRPEVYFHSGNPVTTEDVVFTINRLRGADGGPALSSEFDDVEEIEAPDSRTVVIRLARPNSSFEKFLYRAIVPAGYYRQAEKPIGAGPYRFVEYMPQNRIVLERFDRYYGETGDVDRVIVRIIGDREARLLALRAGELDLADVPTDRLGEVEGQFRIVTALANSVFILGMNNARAPFNDPRVRQAISHAIDREEIIDFVFDGYGVELGSSMSPAMPEFFDEGLVGTHKPDLDAAQQLLEEAGYPDGFPVELRISGHSPIYTNTAQVIQQQLARVGIRTRIQVIEWSMWLSDVYTNRDFQMTLIDFTGKLDPYPVLRRYISDFRRNFLNYENEAYDEIMERALRSPDPETRARLYMQAQEILAIEVPAVFIADYQFIWAMDGRFSGYTPYPLFFHDVRKLRYAPE